MPLLFLFLVFYLQHIYNLKHSRRKYSSKEETKDRLEGEGREGRGGRFCLLCSTSLEFLSIYEILLREIHNWKQ